MAKLELILGNKNYSSWSLRPWVAMKASGLEFSETIVPMMEANHRANFDAAFPAGKVPVLRQGDFDIWESLAICEYINELAPDAGLWPIDQKARTIARSVSAEMASGFVGLRSQFPMNCRCEILDVKPNEAAARDIARIETIWQECREKYGKSGPFLFGDFSIADAMFAPVASRFKTYGLSQSKNSQAYMDVILALPMMIEWYEASRAEEWIID